MEFQARHSFFSGDDGQCNLLEISGELVLQNIRPLLAELEKVADEPKPLHIRLREIQTLDTAFCQLLISLRAKRIAKNLKTNVDAELPSDLYSLMRNNDLDKIFDQLSSI
jgi:ABC-type transporter Mla MlaB component